MDDLIPDNRANRDFRVKFPDDVMQENLAGQLWFGAECLAAGSSIMNREAESSAMRPLAKALTKSLEIVRNLLREQALKGHMNLKVLDVSVRQLIQNTSCYYDFNILKLYWINKRCFLKFDRYLERK